MENQCGRKACHSQHLSGQPDIQILYVVAATENDNSSNLAGESEPDKSLKTWGNFVRERNIISTKLTKVTKRTPADLVMNTVEKVRERKEEQTLLEYSEVKAKPSLRGGLWEQPQRLQQKCWCQPVYEIQRTQVEMGKVPLMEYVAVPEYIQRKEKGVKGICTRKSCKEIGCEKSKYLAKREKELEQEMLQVEPHRPSLKQLMIKGNKPKPPPAPMPDVPVISITECYTTCSPLEAVYAIRINNTVIIKEEPHQCLEYLFSMKDEFWHENKSTWTYYFNTPVTKISKNKLTLTNLGTVTLRYCWKPVKPTRPKLENIEEPVFFFNKNEDLLSPGQTRVITLLFISAAPGIFEEQWCLNICNVNLLDSKSKLSVTLIADAVESDLEYKESETRKLTTYIYNQERDYAIRSILNEVIFRAVLVSPVPCPYQRLLMEENVFLMKNPECFYHQTEVEKLKEMHRCITDNQSWDLSIRSLRGAIINLEFTQRMLNYEMLKKCHSVLLRPWEEGLSVSYRKHVAMKQQLSQFIDMFHLENVRLNRVYCRSVGGGRLLTSKGEQMRRELFRITMKDHLAEAIEIGAALLSSLDLFRFIEFEC